MTVVKMVTTWSWSPSSMTLAVAALVHLASFMTEPHFRAFANDVVHWRDLGFAAAAGCVLIDGDDDIDFTPDGGKSGTAVLVITVFFLHSAQVFHLGECGVGSSGERLVEVVLPHADVINCVRLSLLEAANLIFPQC